MLSASVKPATIRNVLSRRSLHMTCIRRNEAPSNRGLNEKEKAQEATWARKHDAELLEKLKKSLADQEKTTTEIRAQLDKLEGKHK
ncbi:hypothetical protein BY458DRAFT_497927 [Sporodiniella umbellata]|nr:hypothetical protein BY458DRAFT_497927 [Sporodiniella umbellata]